jgi:uncharacterized protein YutE (UPF0331/DUF86 family)/predicted nucleotidyltransferase
MLEQTPEKNPEIQRLLQEVRFDTSVIAIILFGSTVRGEINRDIDICLVDHPAKVTPAKELHYRTTFANPLDNQWRKNSHKQRLRYPLWYFLENHPRLRPFPATLRNLSGDGLNLEDRVLVKIRQLEENLQKLSEITPATFSEYKASLLKRLATERLLQLAIECVIDVCAILVKDLHLGPPQNEDHLFELLRNKLENVETLMQMKRFRNILVHRYETIDDELVFQYATNQIKDFEQFINNIKAFLQDTQKKMGMGRKK